MNNSKYLPPLSISFIWSPADEESVAPILAAIKKSFARDKLSPFSRGLNISLLFFSSKNREEIPIGYPKALAQHNLIFIFTSINTVGNPNWVSYINGLQSTKSYNLIPVAIDQYGLSHSGALQGINCVRAYEWPEANRDLHAVITLGHEIYRFGFVELSSEDVGKSSSIKIFLSHAKSGDTGRIFAESIKQFIDNTNMSRFFDANEISPGHKFNEEIEKHIPTSTILAFESDAYSSRYWCQREILCAKKHNRPIVVLNCLEEYEDRIFPAASNVPCVHVVAAKEINMRDLMRVLAATILETIRHNYVLRSLEIYRSEGWIDKEAILASRPPEIRQALLVKASGRKKICYPEPPIYSDEADWHKDLEIDCFTPLWNISEEGLLKEMRIGITISEFTEVDYSSNHIDADCLIRLSQDLARHLLSRSATLLYGGDLRPNGFSAFILDEAMILKERLQNIQPKIENHLAWPIHISSERVLAWRAKYHPVMYTKEYNLPEDISLDLAEKVLLHPDTIEHRYIWSRSLTQMRFELVSLSDVRVCAGGKLKGYFGKMPGVLEEVIIALETKKPIYLLGGFGGVVGAICNTILNRSIEQSLTEAWQISNNIDYFDLQNYAKSKNFHADYSAIKNILENISISELAQRAGMEEIDYISLMQSQFIDECVYLTLQGLKVIAGDE